MAGDLETRCIWLYNELVLNDDGLVLGNEGFHDAPADEVGHGADAEDYHVGGGLAFEAEEGEVCALSSCPGEELTRAHVDGHRAKTTRHRAKTYDGADG